MGTAKLFGVAVVLGLSICSPLCNAALLYYGGDSGSGDITVSNEENTTVSDARVYDNFTIPAGVVWIVTGLFSNDSFTNGLTTVTQALWEVRTSISSGNGGALLFSGTSSASQTPAGRLDPFSNPEYSILVSVNFALGPGTYWVTVVPKDSGTGRASILTTGGQANMVGTHAYGNDFFSSTFFSANFVNTLTLSGSPQLGNFSEGVIGTIAPEPSALGAITGLVALGLALRKTSRHWKQILRNV